MNEVYIQIILTVGGIFGGLFLLVKYFLNHLEKKNGHMERIAQRFNETIITHLSTTKESNIRLIESNRGLIRAIGNLGDKVK